MSKKYIIAAIMISLCTALFLGLTMPQHLVYTQKNLDVEIEMRTDHDTTVRVYYLENPGEEFSEARCVSQKIAGGAEFQTLHFALPTKRITTLRVDCDTEIEYWDIQWLSVIVDDETRRYEAGELDQFEKNDIQAAELGEEYLTLKTGDADPFIYTECDHATSLNKTVNYRYVVMAAGFVAILLVLLCNHRIIVEFLRGVITARKQIKSLAVSDFKSRFSGSYFGVFWAVAQPIMTIILFWFVFQVGFRSQPISNAPFLLWLVAGMIPWNFFSDAWINGNNAFTGYSYIVKKLVFNIDILPLVKVSASFIMNIIFNLLIILVYALYGRMPVLHLVDMVYYSICLTMLALGLSMITSTLNVFMKDVGQFLNIIMQFMMWLTPIMWDYHMLSSKWSWAYQLNPLFYVTNGYREALIDGHWFTHNYYMMLWFWVLTIALNIIGLRLMRKLKPHFADVL